MKECENKILSPKDIQQNELALRQLTCDYLEGEIDLKEYKEQLNNIAPKFNARELVVLLENR